MFVKDQWRPIAPGMHPELETYDRLRKHDVACVATCLGGGDVYANDKAVQRTFTHGLLPTTLEINNSERYHTRLVIQEIGRPLEQYPNTAELITLTFHALLGTWTLVSSVNIRFNISITGHCEAWEDAGVLHHDISAGNIMIDVTSPMDSLRGFLNDWDICKYKEDLDNSVPALPGRPVRHNIHLPHKIMIYHTLREPGRLYQRYLFFIRRNHPRLPTTWNRRYTSSSKWLYAFRCTAQRLGFPAEWRLRKPCAQLTVRIHR